MDISLKKYNTQHIGKTAVTNEGYILKVIDGSTRQKYCTIQIEDYIKEVRYDSLKTGSIKYPYHKSVQNVGYFGVGEFSVKTHKEAYKSWTSMINRAYNKNHQKTHPSYIGTSVCQKWHNFQVYAKWFMENYKEGWELDKDLLSSKNKIYSKETCLFIPQKLNGFLTNVNKSNTSGHIGVTWHKTNKKWRTVLKVDGKNKFIGYFLNIEEASEAYKKARKIEVNKLRELYRGVLPDIAIDNIM